MQFTLNTGQANAVEIVTGPNVSGDLKEWLGKYLTGCEEVFLLADSNTREYCVPRVISLVPSLQKAEVLEVPAGEKSKSIETAGQLWNALADKGASRQSLLICLGGGVVTDLGGFVASTFKRGIPFIHIPTSLLGMVDAAIGGKTAINLGNIKNQVGTFHQPEAIFIYPGFLETLNAYELMSGVAEVIKTALVADAPLWKKITSIPLKEIIQKKSSRELEDIISGTVAVKCSIVEKDFRETGLRGILNFGHTLGHAFETLSHQNNSKHLSHGHAVALGMICESHLSGLKAGFEQNIQNELERMIFPDYEYYPIKNEDVDFIMDTLVHDKKRKDSVNRFTLVKSPGNAIPGVECTPAEIKESMEHYRTLNKQ
jgi:3-dehydroquinate synthase